MVNCSLCGLRKIEWIELPMEFKGIWINGCYGGFNTYLRDRFNPEYPPDRRNEFFRKNDPQWVNDVDHKYAEPVWVSREEIEKQCGKVIKVLVNKETWESDSIVDMDENEVKIITEKYIIFINEYDGLERLKGIRRE